MGYASVIPSTEIEIYSVVEDEVTLTSVAHDTIISTITTPVLRKKLTHAYMDTFVHEYQNTNALTNAFVSGYTAFYSGGIYRHCAQLHPNTFHVQGNTEANFYYQLFGYLDIAPYLASNTAYETYFHEGRVEQDSLIFRSVVNRLRLYFDI
jgi:hypothetical protein